MANAAPKNCAAHDYINGLYCFTCYHTIKVDGCDEVKGKICNKLGITPKKKGGGPCNKNEYHFICRCGSKAPLTVYHATNKEGGEGILEDAAFKPSSSGIFGKAIYLAMSPQQAVEKAKAWHKNSHKPKIIDTVLKCQISGIPAYIPKFLSKMEKRNKDSRDEGDTPREYWMAKLNRKKADYYYIDDMEDAYVEEKRAQGPEIVAYDPNLVTHCDYLKQHSQPHFSQPDNINYNFHESGNINIEESVIAIYLLAMILLCLCFVFVLGCFTGFGLNHFLGRKLNFKQRRERIIDDDMV